jgi:hypothetical protein
MKEYSVFQAAPLFLLETVEASDSEHFTGIEWGASVASAGALSPSVPLFFVEVWLPLAFQSDLEEEKFLWHSPLPSSRFIASICTEHRDKHSCSHQCLHPNPESNEPFFSSLPHLIHFFFYKVKGLSFILFSFASAPFSVPDALCRDLTPIFSWLWDPAD